MKDNRSLWIILTGAVCIVVFGLVKSSTFLFSPEIKMEGYVLDEKTKEPISGVLVDVKDESSHTQAKLYTDRKGYFSATFNKKHELHPKFTKSNYVIGAGKIEWGFKTVHYETYLRKNKPKTSLR